MPSPVTRARALPLVPALAAIVGVLALVALGVYLAHPSKKPAATGATDEAKAYLSHLALSDVSMQAAENFMKQQVVEVKGRVTDNGPRALRSVDVYCLFYGTNGQELYRERVPIISSKGQPLHPGETRAFRLPFDSLPDGWNQALPNMVIAQITFAE